MPGGIRPHRVTGRVRCAEQRPCRITRRSRGSGSPRRPSDPSATVSDRSPSRTGRIDPASRRGGTAGGGGGTQMSGRVYEFEGNTVAGSGGGAVAREEDGVGKHAEGLGELLTTGPLFEVVRR